MLYTYICSKFILLSINPQTNYADIQIVICLYVSLDLEVLLFFWLVF